MSELELESQFAKTFWRGKMLIVECERMVFVEGLIMWRSVYYDGMFEVQEMKIQFYI